MEIKVNVPDKLAAEARARGLEPKAYVEEILAEKAAAHPAETSGFMTPAEIREWLDSLAQFSAKIPVLPETISRDWIYQDHN